MPATRNPAILSSSIAVILALLATLIVNTLANSLPLGGRNTGEISDSFPVLITPAGYVFSIWALIYLSLIAFSIYQLLPSQRNNKRLAGIRLPFVLSCGFNIAWIFAWHYGLITLSLGFMLGLLLSLIVIYQRLGTGQSRVKPQETWLARVPFSIYLGWITVASVVNVSVVLYHLGWQGWGLSSTFWAVLAIAAATGIALLMSFRRKDIAFTLVLVWAFIGIYVTQDEVWLVGLSAIVAVALVLAGLVLSLVKRSQAV